jgi:hypothetical protein
MANPTLESRKRNSPKEEQQGNVVEESNSPFRLYSAQVPRPQLENGSHLPIGCKVFFLTFVCGET